MRTRKNTSDNLNVLMQFNQGMEWETDSEHHSWLSNVIKYSLCEYPKGQIFSFFFSSLFLLVLILNEKKNEEVIFPISSFSLTILSWKPFDRYNVLIVNKLLSADNKITIKSKVNWNIWPKIARVRINSNLLRGRAHTLIKQFQVFCFFALLSYL